MKKFILIILVVFIVALGSAFIFLVPYGFHMAVHKFGLPQIEALDGKINYEVLTRDHHQSTFMLDQLSGDEFKVEVGTLTFLNPTENHIKINITNTRDITQTYQFLLYFQLTTSGKLRLNLRTEDIDLKDAKGTLNIKGVSIFFGDIGEDDLEILKEKKKDKLVELLFNKDITVELTQMNSDIEGVQYLIKDIEMRFANEEDNDQLYLLSSIKTGEMNGVMDNLPIFSKSSSGNFKFGPLNSDRVEDFVKNALDKSNPMAQNPMFLAMGAMGMINFPISLNVNAGSVQEAGNIDFKLMARMNNKNFMDLKTFEAEVYNRNQKQYIAKLIISSMSDRFAVEQTKYYTSSDKPEEFDRAYETIFKIVQEDLFNDEEKFFESLVADKLLSLNNGFYVFDFKLKDGKVNLGELTMEFSEFLNLPIAQVEKFYHDPKVLEEKIKAAGLVKVQ